MSKLNEALAEIQQLPPLKRDVIVNESWSYTSVESAILVTAKIRSTYELTYCWTSSTEVMPNNGLVMVTQICKVFCDDEYRSSKITLPADAALSNPTHGVLSAYTYAQTRTFMAVFGLVSEHSEAQNEYAPDQIDTEHQRKGCISYAQWDELKQSALDAFPDYPSYEKWVLYIKSTYPHAEDDDFPHIPDVELPYIIEKLNGNT